MEVLGFYVTKKAPAFTAKLPAVPLNAARVLAFLKWFWLRF